MSLVNLRKEIRERSDPERAKLLQGFFKTGKGDYGEGDIFEGITVPDSRKMAKDNLTLSFKELQELLNSKSHEERLIALLVLVARFNKNEFERKEIYEFYLKNTRNINNWDLVDLSSHKIVGEYLLDKNRKILYKLAKSSLLWERRIAIISTFAFIRENQFEDSIKLSEILLKDKHDLIQKAVGWVLREIGKKDKTVLVNFLKKYYKEMPRTMLRYSIEKFDEKTRKGYLKGIL